MPLAAIGFAPLFHASWVWREAAAARPARPRLHWSRIGMGELPAWEAAWNRGEAPSERTFPDRLLDDGRVQVLAGRDALSNIVAGGIVYDSPGALGISNLFGPEFPPRTVFDQIRKATPLVAYERGPALAIARRRGFEVIGALTVWTKPGLA